MFHFDFDPMFGDRKYIMCSNAVSDGFNIHFYVYVWYSNQLRPKLRNKQVNKNICWNMGAIVVPNKIERNLLLY